MTHQNQEESFERAYKKLNAAQREAVDTIEGPVLVIAGPGTGKTQILTLRIANILRQTDTKPENILALTFTESGARNLKERLRGFIGSAAYRVNAFTFHGFADTLIRRYPEAYDTIIGAKPARDLERVALLEEILDDASFTILRPMGDPHYHVKSIMGQISELKREYITPDGLASILATQESALALLPAVHEKGAHKGKPRSEYLKAEKSLNKNRELLQCYRRYEALLRQKRLYDFDDMIIETIRALERTPDMLLDLQETYQYLLADEHQDVNGSQNRILELLASYHDRPNLFVVGDEKQAIFRFQGASLENFLYFETTFPNTKTISLVENYRSGQPILDVAHALIATDAEALKDLRIPLHSNTADATTIRLAPFSHQAIESAFVVAHVKQQLAQGVPPREIAIILRTNSEVEAYATALRHAGVPAAASADTDILEHPIMQAVLELLSVCVDPTNEAALATLLLEPYWAIPQADLFAILGARSYATPLRTLVFSADATAPLQLSAPERLLNVAAVIESARQRSLVESPVRVVEYLLNASGLLSYLNEAALTESIGVVRRLYDEVEAMLSSNGSLTLAGVYDELHALRTHQVALTAPPLFLNLDAVNVMTAHKSKGLEFTSVFIPALTDRKWGGGAVRRSFDIPLTKHLTETLVDEADDDRRLLYVALTRAKTMLCLSYATQNAAGSQFLPSRYLEALPLAQIELVDVRAFEEQFDVGASLIRQPAPPALSHHLIVEALRERGFSATSFNNYLSSPWDYIFRNILRLPEVQPLHLQYGNALHGVLEKATKKHTATRSLPTAAEVRDLLTATLSRLPLSVHEFTRLHEKGMGELVTYFDHIKGSLPEKTVEEFKIRVLLPTGIPELPELLLTGKFDRLDFDAAGRLLRVVDYKTGKYKSRNAIEGNTKDADGNYKRQLTFYAFLLSLYDDERYHCREGMLSFIKADEKGRIHEEAFSITDEEIEALKGELVTAVREIVNGAYLNAPCDQTSSSYCNLAARLFGV